MRRRILSGLRVLPRPRVVPMTPPKPSFPPGRIIREGEDRPRAYGEDRPFDPTPSRFFGSHFWSSSFGFYIALLLLLLFERQTGKAFVGGAIGPATTECEVRP